MSQDFRSERARQPVLPWMRWTLFSIALVLLFFSILYAPGRGPTRPPAKFEWAFPLGIARIVGYTSFCLACLLLRKRAILSLVLLGIGLLVRGIDEHYNSPLKFVLSYDVAGGPFDILLMVAYYALLFVLPAAIFFDQVRYLGSRRTTNAMSDF